MREQLFTYLVESYEQTGLFAIDFNYLGDLTSDMAYLGDWQPLFTYIASELKKQSRIREYIDGEAHIKGFLLAYLGLTNYFLIEPEWEANKGYADFYFRPSPSLPDIEYTYLLEVKYAKVDDPQSRIDVLRAEACQQLRKYAAEPAVRQAAGKTKLRLIYVIFRTWQLEEMSAIE